MVSGIDDKIPLLTIAIPTWNRSISLNKALEHLFPQLENYSKQIEIIISDNGSDDDTQYIIRKFIDQYQQLNIISNKNSANIGFYDNFKKCRELSSGKYLWVLSDDDYVCSDIITVILNKICETTEFAVLYLKNKTYQSQFLSYNLDSDQLLIQESYRIGLISSVIFLNKKEFDEILYKKYHDSAFIGFIFLLNSFNFNKNVIIVEGNCLIPANAKPTGYNFFNIYINHMNHVIDYMHYIKLSSKVIKKFRCSYLKNFLSIYYIIYKAEKKLKFGVFEASSIKEIETWIQKGYSDLWYYWFFFYPLSLIPSSFLSSVFKLRRLSKAHK